MAPSLWVGVDPGARSTGINARLGADPLAWQIVEPTEDETEVGPGAHYLSLVLDMVREVVWTAYRDPSMDRSRTPWSPAVEGVRRPNPHLNRRNGKATTDPTAIIGTAMVLGAVLAQYPDAVIVPPGSNGSGALASYPVELVTPAERRLLAKDPAMVAGQRAAIRHARSAWDVSLRAEEIARLGRTA